MTGNHLGFHRTTVIKLLYCFTSSLLPVAVNKVDDLKQHQEEQTTSSQPVAGNVNPQADRTSNVQGVPQDAAAQITQMGHPTLLSRRWPHPWLSDRRHLKNAGTSAIPYACFIMFTAQWECPSMNTSFLLFFSL